MVKVAKKMKNPEIEMDNIYETVDDFAGQDLDPKAQVNFKVFKFFFRKNL